LGATVKRRTTESDLSRQRQQQQQQAPLSLLCPQNKNTIFVFILLLSRTGQAEKLKREIKVASDQ